VNELNVAVRGYGAGRATAASVNARAGLGATLAAEAIDVPLNPASYRVNLDAMRACLDVGCHRVRCEEVGA
jgi:hypothetical protein